jgi:hypothetical protein
LFKHAPSASQVWLAVHATQLAPRWPQNAFAVLPTPGLWQLPCPSQQPVHVAALQLPPPSLPPSLMLPVHAPDPQAWPAPQI